MTPFLWGLCDLQLDAEPRGLALNVLERSHELTRLTAVSDLGLLVETS